MKGGALFATAIGIVNTLTLNACQFIDAEADRQLFTNIAQALSPFIALIIIRLFVKFDHPPQLIRQEASIDAAIKVCEKHLKSKNRSPEFLAATQQQLEDLLLQKQRLRVDYEKSNTYDSSLQNPNEQESRG